MGNRQLFGAVTLCDFLLIAFIHLSMSSPTPPPPRVPVGFNIYICLIPGAFDSGRLNQIHRLPYRNL